MALLSKSFEETILPQNVQHRGAGQVVCYLRGIPSLSGKHASLPRPQATRPTAKRGRHLLGGPPGASGDPTAWQPQACEHCAGGQKLSICLRAADVDNATNTQVRICFSRTAATGPGLSTLTPQAAGYRGGRSGPSWQPTGTHPGPSAFPKPDVLRKGSTF